jgi:hypothetical protein
MVLDFRKNGVAKILDLIEAQEVTESQTRAKNRKTCPIALIPNARGLFKKSPNSMENMSRSLINYQIYKNVT